jgi:heterodisulfide reductase subunit A-like polyferredoxin
LLIGNFNGIFNEVDTVIWATGFSLFNPQNKPYGYGIFKNVVTNLELEGMVRREGRASRPSDGHTARSVAFIQCVGSLTASKNNMGSRIYRLNICGNWWPIVLSFKDFDQTGGIVYAGT